MQKADVPLMNADRIVMIAIMSSWSQLSAWKTSMLRTQCSNLKLLNQFNDNQHIVKLLYLTFLGHCCALFIGQMLSSFIVMMWHVCVS